MRAAGLFAALALATPAQAEENLAAKIAGNALLLADWHQSRQIAGHPERWRETNIILGDHPSKGQVDAYFLAVIAGLNLLDLALGESKSDRMWIGVTVIEGGYVAHNAGLGLRVDF